MSAWVSVADKLPKEGVQVLMYDKGECFDCGNGYVDTGIFVDCNGYRGRDENDSKVYGMPSGVTHWMPLPKQPEVMK